MYFFFDVHRTWYKSLDILWTDNIWKLNFTTFLKQFSFFYNTFQQHEYIQLIRK